MKRIFSLTDCEHLDSSAIGGKGAWLARLFRDGVHLPKTLCFTTGAYLDFVMSEGLREKINLELNRKEFQDMRWEEIWDASLRIRNLFLKTTLPNTLHEELAENISREFGQIPLAIRSSAPDEDQRKSSFAGLHDSFIGVSGVDNVIHSIKKVWSSLWSDRALLYRRELALSVEQSRMAVVLQELVEGEVSGICFTRDPLQQEYMTIEAVHGLNQGLVDGDVSPDRWLVESDGKKVIEHIAPPNRKYHSVAGSGSARLEELADHRKGSSPLDTAGVLQCAGEMARIHDLYAEDCGGPLDIEWTLATSVAVKGSSARQRWFESPHYKSTGSIRSIRDALCFLQVRPVTALHQGDKKDERSWYLSLHRSFANLETLRDTIEKDMLPQMAREAAELDLSDFADLDNMGLARELRRRQERSSYWTERYWSDCIPFAHGIRLFGEVYNDVMVPEDPHEFVQLLRGEDMLSLRRNELIREIASRIAADDILRKNVETRGIGNVKSQELRDRVTELLGNYGSFFSAHTDSFAHKEKMISKVVLQYAEMEAPVESAVKESREEMEKRFLDRIAILSNGLDGPQLLDLARASYRLRDDDNIYLGRIEEQASKAVREGRKRLSASGVNVDKSATPEETALLLEGKALPEKHPRKVKINVHSQARSQVKARQLLGQPASKGVARGVARVIVKPEQIADFQKGEILVVDSIDPAMTFFAPLAAAIVEQRGGMLIHGAIIAREYGIPCITGIAGATGYISTGDVITVDGYLGIVTLATAK